MLIGNHRQAIEWYQFQRPWVTADPDFCVTVFLTRKPSYRWQTRATRKPAKIAPIQRAYNVVADNTGLSSCV